MFTEFAAITRVGNSAMVKFCFYTNALMQSYFSDKSAKESQKDFKCLQAKPLKLVLFGDDVSVQ